MFGFIIGTLCLIALIRTLYFRRHRHLMFAYGGPFSHGYGPGYGYGPGFGRGHWRGRRWGGHGGGFGFGRNLFAQLDTTPGQEKAIAQAVDALREHMKGSRDELRATRKDVAVALGGDVLDRAALDTALARGLEVTQVLARGLSQTLAEIHAALDGEQRKQLAELIADGTAWHGVGPRRWA